MNKIFNIGFIGTGPYKTRKNGKPTLQYSHWRNMMMRCYDTKFHFKRPTYKNCTVCQEWLNFQSFSKWFDENYVDGFELDKDVLYRGNKIYSPETCCFIPSEINILISRQYEEDNKHYKGVFHAKQETYYVYMNKMYLGSHENPKIAFQTYCTAKEKYIVEVAERLKEIINIRVYNALVNYKVNHELK